MLYSALPGCDCGLLPGRHSAPIPCASPAHQAAPTQACHHRPQPHPAGEFTHHVRRFFSHHLLPRAIPVLDHLPPAENHADRAPFLLGLRLLPLQNL